LKFDIDKNGIELAALFLFLNKSGMYRENKKGMYNIPFCKKDIYTTENLENINNY